jgi:SLA1 Homology Domain 1 (SHD1) protein
MKASHLLFALVGGVAILCGSLRSASAQRGGPANTPTFNIGENVEVKWLRDWYPAKVTNIDRSGAVELVEVKYSVDGQPKTQKIPPWALTIRKNSGGGGTAGASGGAAQLAKEYPVRTWSDSSGKFKIEASYAGQDAAGIKLKKTDGKTIQLALDKLSPQDQQYIAGIAAPDANANPFETAKDLTPGAGTGGGAATSEADRTASWQQARKIVAQPLDTWALTPDPGPQLAMPPGNQATPFLTKGRNNFFEFPARVLINEARSKAIVVSKDQRPSGGGPVRLSTCDMPTGAYEGDIFYSGSTTPMDVSPSGELIVGIADDIGAKRKLVEVARIEGKNARVIRRWDLGQWSSGPNHYLKARFLDDDKILTSNSWDGSLALWDFDKATAIWTYGGSGARAALSAGGKQMAVALSGALAVLDPATGQTQAYTKAVGVDKGTLAFSPDGTRLGHLNGQKLRVWDVATGKLRQEVWFPKQMSGNALDFLGGPYALVDNGYLVNFDKRIVLWHYEVPAARGQKLATVAGGKIWVVNESGSHAGQTSYELLCWSAPDSAARAKDNGIGGDIYVLKPGARVALNINLPNPDDVQKATKNLTDQLKANGMVVDPSAPLVLEAAVNDGGTETKKYSRFAFARDGEEATVTKHISALALKENGRDVWITSGSYGHAPGLVRVKQGQSVQDALNENQANPAQFFYSVKLPVYLARHPEEGVFGSSKVQ